MTKDVWVSIKGLQFTDTDVSASSIGAGADSIETIYPGEYYYRNGRHFVVYEEISDILLEPVKNVIKLRDKEFIISKIGPYNAQMMFMEGKKTLSDYGTPFGNLRIGLDTTKVETHESENSLDIRIEYGLEANYHYIAACHVAVHIAEKNILQ